MKYLLSLGFLGFLAIFVLGISSSDAVNSIVASNHFLYEGETYTPPNVAIEYEAKSYWVIPVTTGSTVVTYFAVDAQSGKFSILRSVNRGLFGLADGLRELQLLKTSISSNSGVEWIFTQTYQTFFNEMALELGDEVFQLNTVESTLKSEDVSVDISSLKAQLRSLSSEALKTASNISAAILAETEFVTKPSEENFTNLNLSYAKVFDSIAQMNAQGLSYKSNLDKLKQQISVADMDAQTKQQLFSLLDIPPQLQALRSYNIYSTQIKGSMDSAFSVSSLRMDSLLSEFDNRILKNEVYTIIYSENERVKKETSFNSLSEIKSYVLSEENSSLWDNQSKVRALEQNYLRASKFYDERNFTQAKKSALLAVDDAVAVYKAGQKKPISTPGISQEFLFQIAGLLIILLAILYIFNNRGKLKGAIVPQKEEVDIYG